MCEECNNYYDYIFYYFSGFNVYIIVGLVKRGVFTLVGEILRYRNDRYYYYYYLLYSLFVVILLLLMAF